MSKGVIRVSDKQKGLTNMGQVNYITQQRTNVEKSPQNNELIVAKNLPYKRRFN